MRAKTVIIPVFASAARTATTNGAADNLVENFDEGTLHIDATTVTGTSPTLIVAYETSPDGGTTWFSHTTGASITAAGKQTNHLANLGRTYRITATIGGTTPSFTFASWLVLKRRA